MTGKAAAMAHGAATIVNAMATGKGAAFGVDLYTKAQVELTDEAGVVEVKIISDPRESTVLAQRAVMRVFRRFGVEKQFGAKAETWSNIPIAKGLKSSSAAANALTLAAVTAIGKTVDDLEAVKLGVDAAFDAKVTVTGAFDDACASYFGGLLITDNLKREVIKQMALPEGLAVLFHVPPKKAYSADSDVDRLKALRPFVDVAFEQASEGKWLEALTLNGLIYSAAWGYDASVAVDALSAGAIAAGLCGKGPAVSAVVPEEEVDSVKAALQRHGGEILQARLNKEKAKVI